MVASLLAAQDRVQVCGSRWGHRPTCGDSQLPRPLATPLPSRLPLRCGRLDLSARSVCHAGRGILQMHNGGKGNNQTDESSADRANTSALPGVGQPASCMDTKRCTCLRTTHRPHHRRAGSAHVLQPSSRNTFVSWATSKPGFSSRSSEHYSVTSGCEAAAAAPSFTHASPPAHRAAPTPAEPQTRAAVAASWSTARLRRGWTAAPLAGIDRNHHSKWRCWSRFSVFLELVQARGAN